MTATAPPAPMTEFKRAEKRIEWGAAALACTILVQTAGIVWWGAKIDQRVSNLEERISSTASASETIARLDERTASMLTTIDRIDRRVSATEERQAGRTR
jgi:hypothetical protein